METKNDSIENQLESVETSLKSIFQSSTHLNNMDTLEKESSLLKFMLHRNNMLKKFTKLQKRFNELREKSTILKNDVRDVCLRMSRQTNKVDTKCRSVISQNLNLNQTTGSQSTSQTNVQIKNYRTFNVDVFGHRQNEDFFDYLGTLNPGNMVTLHLHLGQRIIVKKGGTEEIVNESIIHKGSNQIIIDVTGSISTPQINVQIKNYRTFNVDVFGHRQNEDFSNYLGTLNTGNMVTLNLHLGQRIIVKKEGTEEIVSESIIHKGSNKVIVVE